MCYNDRLACLNLERCSRNIWLPVKQVYETK